MYIKNIEINNFRNIENCNIKPNKKINLKRDSLILTSSNPDLGDAKEEIDIIYDGDEISIGFNAKYIIEILQVIKTENIIFNLKDNISPGRINPEGDEDHISVIMPMRL